MPKQQLYAALVSQGQQDMEAIVMLLSLRIRGKIEYKSYPHANALDYTQQYDFVMVGSDEALESIVRMYRSHNQEPPLIIHLTLPDSIPDYASLYPTLQIIPIQQANLDVMDKTLEYDYFHTVVEQLLSLPD
jgi:hypothetical protein